MDKASTTVARGIISNTCNLYSLTTKEPLIARPKTPNAFDALLASWVPDLDTWHRRLGHCNMQTVLDMAHGSNVEGMPTDLSITPPQCEPCIFGKQTHMPIPKLREGVKATRRLERVYVDLCGPMSVSSCSGRVYSMNIIDDFSSYIWSLPLRTKDEAATILQQWHHAIKNQSGNCLKILITDNSELVSKAVQAWCAQHGINHQLTALYTSTHNGRVEHLHRTILGKARAMQLACNAPTNLWDKFCATAAYLTTLTSSRILNGKTPFELWFGRCPSLSHLHEISCRAFSLIPTNNPKIFQRSLPCILIGYTPHSKAYRL